MADLCVTLDKFVTIPGPNHEPAQVKVFRATERSVSDDVTTFFGLNIGPDNATIEIDNDNIRSVAILSMSEDE